MDNMINKLLSGIDESKREALLKELANVKASDVDMVLNKFGVKLTDEQKTMVTKAAKALSANGSDGKLNAGSILKNLMS